MPLNRRTIMHPAARRRRRPVSPCRKLQVSPLIPCEREVGMAAVSGRMRPRVTPRPMPRDPSVALASATRRCFDLLRLSRRGAMRLCGERLGS
eukprot:7377180-Prymnesium_polylepis.2